MKKILKKFDYYNGGFYACVIVVEDTRNLWPGEDNNSLQGRTIFSFENKPGYPRSVVKQTDINYNVIDNGAIASPKAPTFGGYGDVLDILVQKPKDKQAAVRFFKKLMKGQGRSARKVVTDKLPSYGAAR